MADSLATINARVASYLWTLYLQKNPNAPQDAYARMGWYAQNKPLIDSTSQQQFSQQSQTPVDPNGPPPVGVPASGGSNPLQDAINAVMAKYHVDATRAAQILQNSGNAAGLDANGNPNQLMGDYYEKQLGETAARDAAAAKQAQDDLAFQKQNAADQLAYNKGVAMGFIDGKPTGATVQRAQDIMSKPENSALYEMERRGTAPGPQPGQTVADYLKQAVPSQNTGPTDPTDPTKPPPVAAKGGAQIRFANRVPGYADGGAIDPDGPAYGFAHASEARAWADAIAKNGSQAAQGVADGLEKYKQQIMAAHNGLYPKNDYAQRYAAFAQNWDWLSRNAALAQGTAANKNTQPYDPSVMAFYMRMGGDPRDTWDKVQANIAGMNVSTNDASGLYHTLHEYAPDWMKSYVPEWQMPNNSPDPASVPQDYYKAWVDARAKAGGAYGTNQDYPFQNALNNEGESYPFQNTLRGEGESYPFQNTLKGQGEDYPFQNTIDGAKDAVGNVTGALGFKGGGKQGGVTFGGEPHWIVNSKGQAEAAITEDGKPETVKGHGSIEVIPLDPTRNKEYEAKKAKGQVQTDIAQAAHGAQWSTPPATKTKNAQSRSRALLPDGSMAETGGAQDGRADNGQNQSTLPYPGEDIDRMSKDKDAAGVRPAVSAGPTTYSPLGGGVRPTSSEVGPAGRPWTLPALKPAPAPLLVADGGQALAKNIYNTPFATTTRPVVPPEYGALPVTPPAPMLAYEDGGQAQLPMNGLYHNGNTPLEQAIDKYAGSDEAKLAMRVGSQLHANDGHGPWGIKLDPSHPMTPAEANNVDFSTNYMSNDYNAAVNRVKAEDPTAFQTNPMTAAALAAHYVHQPTVPATPQAVRGAYGVATSNPAQPPMMRTRGVLRYADGGNMGLPADPASPSDPAQRDYIGSGGSGMIGTTTAGGPAFGFARGAPYAASYRNIPGLPGVSIAQPWKFAPRDLLHSGQFGRAQLMSYWDASGGDPTAFADQAQYANPGNTQTQYTFS